MAMVVEVPEEPSWEMMTLFWYKSRPVMFEEEVAFVKVVAYVPEPLSTKATIGVEAFRYCPSEISICHVPALLSVVVEYVPTVEVPTAIVMVFPEVRGVEPSSE